MRLTLISHACWLIETTDLGFAGSAATLEAIAIETVTMRANADMPTRACRPC